MNGFASALKRNTRWILSVALLFLLQIALIFWLSDYSQPPIRKPAHAPTIQLADTASAELLALSDPTLFALPHFRGFSGKAWLKAPSPPDRWFDWTEEPRWLPMPAAELPRTISLGSPANLDAFEVVSVSTPEPPSLIISAPAQFRQKSALKVDGALAGRKLTVSPNLPSWPFPDLLTNTVVGVMVNAEGLPRSETLLVRSGLVAADEYALKTARELRFEPLAAAQSSRTVPDSVMTRGELIFQWRGTVAAEPNK